MFGPRLSTVFASRWRALWWSAGILFLAWQLTPAPDPQDAPPPKASNPWAKSPQTAADKQG